MQTSFISFQYKQFLQRTCCDFLTVNYYCNILVHLCYSIMVTSFASSTRCLKYKMHALRTHRAHFIDPSLVKHQTVHIYRSFQTDALHLVSHRAPPARYRLSDHTQRKRTGKTDPKSVLYECTWMRRTNTWNNAHNNTLTVISLQIKTLISISAF